MALALLAIANLKPETPWSEASIHNDGRGWKLTSREIIAFQNENWGQNISSGSYDDIRRKDLEILLLAGIAIASAGNPAANQNNPTRRYAVSEHAGNLLKTAGAEKSKEAAKSFIEMVGSLEERMERRRPKKISAKLPDGKLLQLAVGEHNALQKAILEEFIPRFVAQPSVLYLGDASNKSLHVETERLSELGLKELAHDMLPDVVVVDEKNGWLLLIEAVHSSNPISQMRHLALENFTFGCPLPKVFVSVFASRAEFRKWVCEISWETEVWLADSPGHMIHFNGDKFLGPYQRTD